MRRTWRRSCSLALAALAALGAGAHAQGVAIEPGGAWKVGDEVRFERIKTRADSRAGAASGAPVTARTPVTIRVVEVGAEGSVVAWRYGKSEIDGATGASSEAVEAVQRMAEGLEYVVELDRDGDFKALRNWQAVRDQTLAAVDRLVLPTAPVEMRAAVEQAKAMFATREAVSSFLLREARLFFMFYGWRLDPGETEGWDEQLPNPLGGPPVPARATLRLAAADASVAVLRYTLAFDRAKAGAVIADSIAALARRLGKPVDALTAEIGKLEVDDAAELAFDLRTRWPQRLTHERRIAIGDRGRIDRVEIVRVP